MSAQKRLILHIGGPKCGSSALQAALSARPDLRSETGSELAYIGLRPRAGGTGWSTLKGRMLTAAAVRSAHGYVSWPNLGRTEDPAPVFTALDKIWRGLRPGTVPVLSNEGWVGQSETFQAHLPHWFEDPGRAPLIEVQAYARPPLDWLNSAYWQWGIWSGRSFQGWLENMSMPYRLGAAFARWSALPTVRMRLHLSGDVLAHFNADHGVDLKPAPSRNSTLPPAMVGFLMRNRRFRPTAHDSATEFVFQRWCDLPDAPRLWALMPRHVQMVKQAIQADVETLLSLLPEAEVAALRKSDPRWFSNKPYHALIRAGRSKLDDPEQQAQLYAALCKGVRAAAQAAGKSVPRLDPPLATNAGVHAWDVLIAAALDHLIAFDQAHRRAGWSPLAFARR